jgi:hypothetical protein
MSEDITNAVDTTSQVDATASNDTNTVEDTATQTEADNSEGTVENSNEGTEETSEASDTSTDTQQDTKQPTVEELQAKLKEYEVRDEEDRMIREQLGLNDIDSRTYDFMNIDQQIVNEGKQVYLRLCNEYGVDANPNKIDASVEELKKTDPAKAYEFQRRFEQLGQEVEYKRGMVQQQNSQYEVNKFSNDYGNILNASPALTDIMVQYVQNYGGGNNIYGQLESVLNTIMPAYQEAFNAGRQYALQDKAKKDTSGVSGGVATANTQTYTSGNVFTREQIAKMSDAEFAKYEKEIERQMIEGKII